MFIDVIIFFFNVNIHMLMKMLENLYREIDIHLYIDPQILLLMSTHNSEKFYAVTFLLIYKKLVYHQIQEEAIYFSKIFIFIFYKK